MVGHWTCNPEVLGSNPSPCHGMDLSSVAPNSTPPCLVNSQLVSLPPVGILNLLYLKCIEKCHWIVIEIALARNSVVIIVVIIIIYETSFVRLATKFSQVTVNFTLYC